MRADIPRLKPARGLFCFFRVDDVYQCNVCKEEGLTMCELCWCETIADNVLYCIHYYPSDTKRYPRGTQRYPDTQVREEQFLYCLHGAHTGPG